MNKTANQIFVMSRPQRVLAGCGVAIFVLGILLMGLIGYQYLDALRPRPIRIENLTAAELPVDENNAQVSKADFGVTLKQNSGTSVVLWSSRRVALLAGASVKIEANQITAGAGKMFIDVTDALTLVSDNGHKLNLERVSGVYDANLRQFFIFTGEVKVTDATATVNQVVILGGSRMEVGRFNRTELSSADWQTLIGELARYNLLPTTLADTAAPPLSEITPASGTEVANAELRVTGITDPETLLYLGTERIQVGNDGSFTLDLELTQGDNSFSLIAIDASGNETNLLLTYKYAPVQAPTAASCSGNGFSTELICLINQYRVANGLNALNADWGLSAAAANHSAWMAANNSLNHDQTAGSANEKFFQRCANAGASCDAENIAWATPTITPSQVLQMWQNSAGHNANMLGSHSLIGVGISGTYVTAVFQ